LGGPGSETARRGSSRLKKKIYLKGESKRVKGEKWAKEKGSRSRQLKGGEFGAWTVRARRMGGGRNSKKRETLGGGHGCHVRRGWG